jgi:hypothetical protein
MGVPFRLMIKPGLYDIITPPRKDENPPIITFHFSIFIALTLRTLNQNQVLEFSLLPIDHGGSSIW